MTIAVTFHALHVSLVFVLQKLDEHLERDAEQIMLGLPESTSPMCLRTSLGVPREGLVNLVGNYLMFLSCAHAMGRLMSAREH